LQIIAEIDRFWLLA